MKTIKNIFLFTFFFLFNIPNFSQVKDTLYYSENWKETDRENHQFYRLLPLETIGELSLIIDYHKNSKMQMQGYAYTNNLKKLVGDIYWYDKDGLDDYYSSYENKTNITLKYYHHNGVLWKKVTYKNDEKDGAIKIYDSKNSLRYSNVYKEGNGQYNLDYFGRRSSKKECDYILQWLDSKNTAKKIHYSNYKIQKEEVYSKDGSLLESYSKSDFINNKLKNGTYYNEKTENGFVVDLSSTTYKSFQSKVFKLEDINYVNINKSYDNFIKEKDSNQIQYMDLELFYDKTIPEKIFRTDLSKLEKNNIKKLDLISVKKIKKQKVSALLRRISKKQWESFLKRKEYYSKDSIQYKTVFKLYNKSLFVEVELKYDDRRPAVLGSYYAKDDDKNKKWRVSKLNMYTINVILLNGKRPILALSNREDFKYFIVPLTNGTFQTNISGSEQKRVVFDKDIDLSNLSTSNAKEYYSVSTKDKKKYIGNQFNEVLIDKPYDSIKRIGQFIIGENSKKIDVYNLKLDKLRLKNSRIAYYDRWNLQVLSNNKVYYINALGIETKRHQISYGFCGLVSSTDFIILDSIKKKPIIRIHYEGRSGRSSYKKLVLINLVKKQDITFLNKKKSDGYDGNSDNYDGYINRTQTLLVKDNNKFGLYSYSKNTSKIRAEEIPIKNDSIFVFEVKERLFKIKAKQILPIEYDSIELKEPLIILKKDNKVGIYKDKKGLIYKSLGNIDSNFMRYEKIDGEKGWMDINTFKDYPDQ